MKILKSLLLVLAIFVLAIIGTLTVFIATSLNSGKPKITGTLDLPGLSAPVTVKRDSYGVPHIFADNENDAYMALGYLHAQDRLWEMDVFRRMAQGRLSEVFGKAPVKSPNLPVRNLVEQDIFYRTIGLAAMWDKIPESSFDTRTLKSLKAYITGVNAGTSATAGNLPPEFKILMYKPEKWDLKAIGSLGRLVSWGLSSNWDNELLRYEAIARLGREQGWLLQARHSDPGPYVIDPKVKKYSPNGKIIPDSPWYLPPALTRPDFFVDSPPARTASSDIRFAFINIPSNFPGIREASNNWVVSGDRSASGKPILANDPHLIHNVPSVFYQAHLTTKDGLDVMGFTFPGMPFVVLGHNADTAWGVTTNHADVQDLFVEKPDPANPANYIYRDKSLPFATRREIIDVRGGDPVTLTVRSTIHGPVINPALPQLTSAAPPIALQWGAAKGGGEDFRAYFRIARSRTIGDIRSAISDFYSPIQNWLFADNSGHIGYFPGGYIPIRKKGDGTVPVPGWTGEYDWTGSIPPDQIPQLYDPPNGFIVTANNKVVPEEDYPYPFCYEYNSYRADRVTDLLQQKPKLTIADMEKIQFDNYAVQARRLAPIFIAACREKCDLSNPIVKKSLAMLSSWDYTTGTSQTGPTLFYTLLDKTIQLTLADDLPPAFFNRIVHDWSFDPKFDNGLEDPNWPFFDDKSTPRLETRDEILAQAFEASVSALTKKYGADPSQWQWGKAHVAHLKHPLGALPFLGPIFNTKPFPASGSRATINNSHFEHLTEFSINYGPVFRHIIDMADTANAVMILDIGTSGHPKSPHYADQTPLWATGKFIPMSMSPATIDKDTIATLILKPR